MPQNRGGGRSCLDVIPIREMYIMKSACPRSFQKGGFYRSRPPENMKNYFLPSALIAALSGRKGVLGCCDNFKSESPRKNGNR